MEQQNNFSKRNRNIVVFRWKKEEQKYNLHLKKILKSKTYKIFKSRLLGFLAGDGSVSIRREKKKKTSVHHDISFYPDHHSMIGPFIEAFTYLYLKKPTVKNMKNHYSVRVSSKQACLDLLRTSNFGTLYWQVPLNFLNLTKYKIEWLRAFFDCESSIGKRVIQVQSVNKKGIHQVQTLLKNFNIESKIYEYKRKNKKWNTNYILCIMKKESRKKFLNTIGFNHIIKLEKLKKQFKASVPESG